LDHFGLDGDPATADVHNLARQREGDIANLPGSAEPGELSLLRDRIAKLETQIAPEPGLLTLPDAIPAMAPLDVP